MKLGTLLQLMVLALGGVAVVSVGALQTVSGEISSVKDHLDVAVDDLELHVQLNQDVRRFFYFKYQEALGERSATPSGETRAHVLGAYQRFTARVEREVHEAGEAEELADIAKSRRLFEELAADADRAVALARSGDRAGSAKLCGALDDRYERELLPLLHQAIEREENEVRESVAHAGLVASRSQRVGLAAALAGLLAVLWVSLVWVRRIRRDVDALVAGMRAFAGGKAQAAIPGLSLAEFDELGRTVTGMAGELRAAQETKVRVEKLAAVGQLAAGVGHEIRNPLSAARNAIHFVEKSLIKEGQLTDRIAQFLTLADRELGVCNRTVQDLLDFARERKLERAQCSLHTLVAEVVEVAQRPDNVLIENLVPADLPPVELDRDQFRQVINNLTQNAADAAASPEGGRVSISAEKSGANVLLKVTDTGKGISPENLERIFEPLFTTKTRGTGLGLAIVKGVVTRHGGKISIDTKLGAGSTFAVEIPLQGGCK